MNEKKKMVSNVQGYVWLSIKYEMKIQYDNIRRREKKNQMIICTFCDFI